MNSTKLPVRMPVKHSFTIASEVRQLFPMKLVAFEQMMIIDDRPDVPMVAEVTMRWSGNVDVDALVNAISEAVTRHPLLYCRLESSWQCGLRWVLPESGRGTVRIDLPDDGESDRAETLNQFRQRFDLTMESGVRFLIIEHSDHLELRIAVHHACCDGFGVFLLLEDVLTHYHNRTSDPGSQLGLALRDPQRLNVRGSFPIRSESWSKQIAQTWFGIKLAHRFGREQPISLRGSDIRAKGGCGEIDTDLEQTDQIDIGFHELLKPLRVAASRKGVTLNDLLIRDLFLTVHHWNLRQPSPDPETKQDCFRLMMPCSLRADRHVNMPAANVMSYSLLSRTDEHLRDADRLLAGICDETQYIRNENASLYFIRTLQVAHRIPGGIRQVAEAEKCLATVLLSNIADPTLMFSVPFTRVGGKLQAGNSIIEEIHARPPLRPLTRWGVVISTYGRHLSVGSAFDSRAITPVDRRELLAIYHQNLEASISR